MNYNPSGYINNPNPTYATNLTYFSFTDLLIIYNQYLLPYLDLEKMGYSVEDLLMGCVRKLLIDTDNVQTIWDINLQDHIATDYLNLFFEKISTVLDNSIREYDSLAVEQKLVVDTRIKPGYIVETTSIKYLGEFNG